VRAIMVTINTNMVPTEPTIVHIRIASGLDEAVLALCAVIAGLGAVVTVELLPSFGKGPKIRSPRKKTPIPTKGVSSA
jgi:hypothetical protein